jgi:hypothetical protein
VTGVTGGTEIAECSGLQKVGNLNVQWRTYISASENTDQPTLFRIYREVN